MIYQLNNPFDADRAMSYLENAIKQGWNIQLKHICPKRTDKQNRYLHAILGYFGTVVGLPLEDVKRDIFKRIVNPTIFFLGTKKIGRKDVECWKSTADISTAELSLAIDRFRFFAQSEMGVYIASPEDENFIVYCEQQIEKDREFI